MSEGLYDDASGPRNSNSALTAATVDVSAKDAEIKDLKEKAYK